MLREGPFLDKNNDVFHDQGQGGLAKKMYISVYSFDKRKYLFFPYMDFFSDWENCCLILRFLGEN